MTDPKRCRRCNAALVQRCGCGSPVRFEERRRLERGMVVVGEVPICTAKPTHAQHGGFIPESCLCARANVGPDKRDDPPASHPELRRT